MRAIHVINFHDSERDPSIQRKMPGEILRLKGEASSGHAFKPWRVSGKGSFPQAMKMGGSYMFPVQFLVQLGHGGLSLGVGVMLVNALLVGLHDGYE